MKYEFHVGDYVENKDGDVGYIEKICDCEYCKERGFFEPYIRYKNGEADYLTIHEAERVEQNFKRIGRYDFTKPEQPKEIQKLPNELPATFRVDGKICKVKNQVEANKWAEMFYPVDLINKINELVDAVNELKEEN